jgi:pyridinium-3,5-biscarboxylic acid mononucleotide sulfurtransferase
MASKGRDNVAAGSHAGAWDALLELLRGLGPMTVACSGGIDSRFLAHATLRAGVPVQLVHVGGPHVPPADTAYVLDWAESCGLAVRVLRLDPLALPEVAAGGRDRCYACKSFLFSRIKAVASGRVCDGSNASDATEFRPGRRALQELAIRSPLAEVGLTKDMIRSLARETGLARPDQRSAACLLTRLPYGLAPDRTVLARLAAGEGAVEEALCAAGHAEAPFRLRLCETGAFELHLGLRSSSTELLRALEMALCSAGFPRTPVLCMEAVSGYFDKKHVPRKCESASCGAGGVMLDRLADD